MKKIAMIPARRGSQRLKEKNLLTIGAAGLTLIEHAVIRCREADCFDEIWFNTEDEEFGNLAYRAGAWIHHRPEELADNKTTHQEFIKDFLRLKETDYLFQVHTIAPLLSPMTINRIVSDTIENKVGTGLTVERTDLECLSDNCEPINFSMDKKNNSQDLRGVKKITWGMTGWDVSEGFQTWKKPLKIYTLSKIESIVIKKQEDYEMCSRLYNGTK
jgi:CMP-N-acetylneuraminic acid synthetase